MVNNGLGHDWKLSRVTLRSDLKEGRENFGTFTENFTPAREKALKCLFGTFAKSTYMMRGGKGALDTA